MKNSIENAKLLVFDLDGTLYEDTDHFDYYCRQLQARVKESEKEAFWQTYESMKKGEHPVSIGKVYDIKNDTAVTVEPLSLQVTKVESFQGEEWPAEKVSQEYSGELVYDFERLIAIGDGWWLPYATAIHFGLSQDDTWECYNATKEYMVTDEFSLTKTPGLKEALIKLCGEKKIVLMTNSEREDVGRLLDELELTGLFHAVHTESQKPLRSKQLLQEILESFNVKPEEAVSIGDNFINEIAPALLIGMKAIYIQASGTDNSHDNLVVVPTLANAF
ncbi:HAD family hydrolase [Fictibacillus aquaticus]|uniref:Hydrolase n=1 Tax=Fictibacillus aquaticus TaxID=2021314 RepID=A0A235FFE9_9BACL|nr:HAD family hydrolase [Fictibacillus aquaticus]OYD59657.1 hydrolase [Fictibacillus aquaticus]